MAADDGLPPASAAAPGMLDLEDAYRSYHGPLVSFLSSRLPEKSVAADIAHTLFASLAARPETFSVRDMRHYLFRAARNQLADYYRRQETREGRAKQYAADAAALNGDGAPCPEEEAIRRDKLNRLRAIIAAMPEKRRTVFLLARFQELTETEIAARLGMNPAAVRQHVSRAMRECQREMLQIFDEPPAEDHTGKRDGRTPQRR